MSSAVTVRVSGGDYPVFVSAGLLDRIGEEAEKLVKPATAAIVTDSTVGPLYSERLQDSLIRSGFSVQIFTVPSGETSKSMDVVANLCEQAVAAGLDRGSCIFALGGGVVGDLTGFLAAIYYRGIRYFQVPTTVVAQVDSAIGGKTGVNARGGKNLIGAFHQPQAVFSDPEVLSTLPPREYNEGFAEIIKHAAIRDPEMLEHLHPQTAEESAALMARNASIKAIIVSQDEFETKGLRAHLNFGHTIGHAIENVAGYGQLLHGEAISLGLSAALYLSVRKAGLREFEAEKVRAALRGFSLPLQLPENFADEAILRAMRTDKKFARGAIRFVLVPELGQATVSSEITEADILSALDFLRRS